MKKRLIRTLALAIPLAASASVLRAEEYSVTITNLTQAQYFTPILVASHEHGHPVFLPGQPASGELEAVAEGGDTAPLAASLEASDEVYDISVSEGLLAPGDSVTVEVEGRKDYRYISLVSMLIPTNDAFIGLSGVKIPRRKSGTAVIPVPAYDAGTELNDESCASIPGPVCGGAGMSAEGGEGFIHVHPGIHGTGDLSAVTYDWRNPAALVTIERMK